MDYIDYYKVLGISKNATEKEIKKAYRKLARKYHPDVNPNDKQAERKFKEVNEANEVLSHPENRKKYDAHGKDWQHADDIERARKSQHAYQRASGFGGEQSYREGAGGADDFSDFFSSMFGGAGGGDFRSRQAQFRGQDFNAELQLSLNDVYQSHTQTLTVNGKKIRLTIPAGVAHGQTIKVKGHGGPGVNGGPKGDLYITFSIINNTPFKRDQGNLYLDVDLDVFTAVLGGELLIDTFSGKAKLSIKPNTQNGTKVRLKGKGFPLYKKEGQYGDLIVTYRLQTPTLTAEQKRLFQQIADQKK